MSISTDMMSYFIRFLRGRDPKECKKNLPRLMFKTKDSYLIFVLHKGHQHQCVKFQPLCYSDTS